MAESVARVKILAQVEGLEGFDKLKGAFKGLQQAIGPTDQQLAKARQDIIAFGEAGKQTEQVIRGQIDALKALKAQAGAGGQLYTTLGADIRRLEGDVRELNAAYVNLATGASYTAKQLANLTPATRQPGMLDAQVEQMRAGLERFKLLSREYIQGVADINKATQEGARNQQTNNLFSNALNANPYLQQNTFFFDATKQFEKQALSGGLPATVAGKQQEISRIKEQLQNVLRDASSLEPLLNDIRRIENNLASTRGPAVTGGGTRSTIPGLEGAGREMSTDWQKARITLGQLTTEYERLKQAQQEQVFVLQNQLIEAENELQRMLNGTTKEQEQAIRADERRARVQEKLAQIQQDTIKAPGVGGYRDESGAILARGSEGAAAARANLLAQVAMPPREISSLYKSIGDVGYSRITNDIERMGNSFQEVANDIRLAKSASDGSINSLQSLRGSWAALRNTVSENSKEFREATRELQKLDRQLEKTEVGGLRGKVGYIGQGIGAIASAGIFGGPEGAAGGALGGAIGALGGPAGFAAGSFIGSSIGAYAGMGRQAIGQYTTYAADISKLEIALKGVTKTQEEYQRALAASASVTRDFNVPQLEATKGMTQLSAAVIGAGGKVADAEVVFRNVTAAIKASGGSAEDVQGALTALGQIFSKGKVSAEELQGQLGERLPGAVTMFAKATGRTLPQLQKDLEQGVVGLADLMKFVVSDQGLGQFEQRAKSVAQSSAEAGARLTTTWNDTKRAIGEALLPLGAQIQDSLAKALREATPALVEFAKGAATVIKLFVDNAGVISGVLKTLLGFGAVAGAAIGLTQLAAAIASLAAGLTGLGGAMGVATLAAESLGITIAAVPGIGWIAAGVTALGLLTVELYNNNDAFRTWANNLATVISTDFKNAWDNAVSIVSSATGAIVDIWNGASSLLSSVGSGIATAFDDLFGGIFGKILQYWNSLPEPVRRAMSKGASSAVGGLLAPGNPAVGYVAGAAVRAGQMGPNAQGSAMFGRYDVAGSKTDLQTSLPGQLTNWQIQQEQEKEKSRQDAERAAAQQQQLNESIAKARIALSDAQFRHDQELARKRYEYEIELDQKRRDNWVKMQTGAARSAAGMVSGFFGEIDTLLDKLRQGREEVAAAAQKRQSTAAMASVTVSAGPIATSTSGNAMGLREGAAVPGPPAALWNGGRGTPLRSGAAAATRRDISAEGSAAVAAADLAAAEEGLKLVEGQFGNLLELFSKSFVLDFTDQIRQQNAALRDSAEITSLRNRLELEGQRPEFIEGEVKKAEAIQKVSQENAVNTGRLEEAKSILAQLQAAKEKDLYAISAQEEKINTLNDAIGSNNNNLQEYIRLTNEATAAQIAFNDALRFRQDDRIGLGLREGAQQYVESIGTMREATAQLAQTGIKGVEDAIFSLVTTGTANFKEFAANILKDTARMIIQQLILRTIMQAIGAIGGGGGFGKGYFDPITGKGVAGPNFGLAMGGVIGRNGLQPFAMGGIVTKPTLFRYANGGVPGMGLMGEAGPEAIIPLRRGRDGKLGVAGGGNSTNVTVNVDASGSSVQGNSGQGEQLGRAISQAVQQELIKQRRPGGLLAA